MKTFNDLNKGDYVYRISNGCIFKCQIYSFRKYKHIFKFNFGKKYEYWTFDMYWIDKCQAGQWITDPEYIVNVINSDTYESTEI